MTTVGFFAVVVQVAAAALVLAELNNLRPLTPQAEAHKYGTMIGVTLFFTLLIIYTIKTLS